MIQPYITLLSALSISIVAAWFSIVGLMTLFSGAQQSVFIMAAVLEIGKLVSISWLYWNWTKSTHVLKGMLLVAVLVLMFITSMGIFGYLSKAQLSHEIISTDIKSKIERIDMRIEAEKKSIIDAETVLSQLDTSIDTLIKYDRIRGPDGAIAARELQKAERESLRNIIDQSQKVIDTYQDQRFAYTTEIQKSSNEVGPVKYLSELIYGESEENISRIIMYLILIIVMVFDPLAVMLLIAANNSLQQLAKSRSESSESSITQHGIRNGSLMTTDIDDIYDDIEDVVLHPGQHTYGVDDEANEVKIVEEVPILKEETVGLKEEEVSVDTESEKKSKSVKDVTTEPDYRESNQSIATRYGDNKKMFFDRGLNK